MDSGERVRYPFLSNPCWGDVLNEPHPPITQASARSVTDAPATREVAPGPAAPEPPAKPAGRTVQIFGRTYPFSGPSIRDPRLHLAAVIISIHFLGQIALGFRVSVPQILVAILVCAVIEVGWTLHKTGTLVWPASAMLTGSGVALILRLSDMQSNDHWTWRGWYVFALVAGLSLLTKYVIRYRGSHIFNPSNVGLVAAFLLLGSTRIEPLDFWWAPFDGWMVAAYLIILVGGLLITARLHLLGMSAAFWLTLAVGIGVLAASGHCMTARWSFEPVCGAHFWWVIVFSPEILIFLFFMITDPKTSPAGRVARVAFGIGVAMVCTLLIARRVIDLVRRAVLLDAAVVHHDDAVRELERLLLIVRDEHAGHVQLVVQPAQPAPQLLPHPGVERAERLVEQQHARLDGERARERHALPLAAGELRRIALGEPVELHERRAARARGRGSRASDGRSRRGRTRRPKATFSNTVMWRNSA